MRRAEHSDFPFMKNHRSLLFLAALSAALLPLSGCAKNDAVASAVQDTKTAAKDLAADVKQAAVDSWDAVKDFTFEKRAEFSAGLDRMAAKHDAEVAAANAKVKGLPETAAKERDHANKEFADARANLKAALADVGNATADTWAATKEKSAQAWQRLHAAYAKLIATPTS